MSRARVVVLTLSGGRRLLDDPKPLIVGISWVVKCAEVQMRVDEAPYIVDVSHLNVAGVQKVGSSRVDRALTDADVATVRVCAEAQVDVAQGLLACEGDGVPDRPFPRDELAGQRGGPVGQHVA